MYKPEFEIADKLGRLLIERKLLLTTAESCTGGKIASALCAAKDTPLFYGAGFVTFNDDAKKTVLSVSPATLRRYTAVSRHVVTEMAQGAIEHSGADVSIAVSGYAGPEGGEDGTPPGTVWFGWHISAAGTCVKKVHFEGDCQSVIEQATDYALAGLLMLLAKEHAA